jgi:assimilatory nitrate reductase catalytic subunit
MTRTGKTSRLLNHLPESFMSIHPCNAKHAQIADSSLVKIKNERGEIIVRAKYSSEQTKGNVFVPIHWNQQVSSHGTVNRLLAQITDEISGQPESKFAPVQIEPYKPAWQGFLLTKNDWKIPQECHWWVKIRQDFGWQFELAGETQIEDWENQLKHWFGDYDWLIYQDKKNGHYRYALLENSKLIMTLFISNMGNALPQRNAIKPLFNKENLTISERLTLLTGQPSSEIPDVGDIVCACFNVGRKTLQQAIEKNHFTTTEQLGEHLKAGTNCGSCLPELRALLTAQK